MQIQGPVFLIATQRRTRPHTIQFPLWPLLMVCLTSAFCYVCFSLFFFQGIGWSSGPLPGSVSASFGSEAWLWPG